MANLLSALEATNPLHFMATLMMNGTAVDRANLTLGLDEKSLAKAGSKKKAAKTREEMIRFEKVPSLSINVLVIENDFIFINE